MKALAHFNTLYLALNSLWILASMVDYKLLERRNSRSLQHGVQKYPLTSVTGTQLWANIKDSRSRQPRSQEESVI